jgi:sarcosine oxidase subunit beta
MAGPHMVFIDHVLGTYFRPESDVLTLVGVPCQVWDVDPDTMPTGLPPQAPAEGAQILTHRIPALERASLARGYRAFDLYSADRHAILGAVPGIDGLYLATAFSGSGFKTSPAVGTCLAELIVDGRAHTVDIEAFRLARFAAGRRIEGRHPYAPRRDHLEPVADRAPLPA